MVELPVLSPIEQRVLGALMEKQVTVPASYPLTLGALRTACNQKNSREPVTDYDEPTIEAAARALKDRELTRVVWGATGQRTLKWHQRLEERLELTDAQKAIITVQLLRGPQSPGELKTRTERMHVFADRAAVEAELAAMAGLPTPLVAQLPRQPGQQDHRWAHLLGPLPEAATTAVTGRPRVDLDTVLCDGPGARNAKVVTAYDLVASSYADALLDELEHKAFDRWLLGRVATLAADRPVVDVGCGPGHVTAALAEEGADVTGIDLSPGMVAEAQLRFPALDFAVGDLMALIRPHKSDAWGAVTAWYSLVHLAASELPAAMAALARPLATGGWLAVALHIGSDVQHAGEWFGHEVDVDFVLHDHGAVLTAITSAGLDIVESYVRSPLADVEVPTDRLYVLARKG